MKRVLLTGMSGTGKSTLIGALAALGYRAIDLDTPEWSEWVRSDGDELDPQAHRDSIWSNRDWVWREGRVHRLLSTEDAEILFAGGTASNQGKFRARFNHIILLSAPESVIVSRLSRRTSNAYGKNPDELARILLHVQTVEPLIRRTASAEVDTDAPIDQVLGKILTIVGN
ncbi:MAG: AAA family ATPase [Chloroflexota bacterium]